MDDDEDIDFGAAIALANHAVIQNDASVYGHPRCRRQQQHDALMRYERACKAARKTTADNAAVAAHNQALVQHCSEKLTPTSAVAIASCKRRRNMASYLKVKA